MNMFDRLCLGAGHSLSATMDVLTSMDAAQKADVLNGILHMKANWVWDSTYNGTAMDTRIRRMIAGLSLAEEIRVENPARYTNVRRQLPSWFATSSPSISAIFQELNNAPPYFDAACAMLHKNILLSLWLRDIDDAKAALKEHTEERFLTHACWDDNMYPYVNQDSINEVACRVFTPQFYTYASAVLSTDDWTPPTLSALVNTYQRRHHPEPVLPLPNWDTPY